MNDTPAFYSRSEDERIALTERAISLGGTVLERWTALAATEADGWSARAAMAASWIADQPGVVDFGCGLMTLERFLRPGQAYVPCDVVRRDPRTVVCDLNREPPPQVGVPAAVCLGLFEYLHDPVALLRALARTYRVCVVSYCVTDALQAMESRRSHAWVNDLSTYEIESLFAECQWSIERSAPVDGVQRMWRLTTDRI